MAVKLRPEEWEGAIQGNRCGDVEGVLRLRVHLCEGLAVVFRGSERRSLWLKLQRQEENRARLGWRRRQKPEQARPFNLS